MTYDVFISYARKDGLEFAERLEHDLSAQGYSLWRDKRNLDVYQDFTAEIEIGEENVRYHEITIDDLAQIKTPEALAAIEAWMATRPSKDADTI